MKGWIKGAIKELREKALRQSQLEKHERAMLRHKEVMMTEKSNSWDWSPREADKYAEGPSDYEVVFRTAEFMVEKAMIDLDSEMKWVQELTNRHPEEIIKNKDLVLKFVAEATNLSKKLNKLILFV